MKTPKIFTMAALAATALFAASCDKGGDEPGIDNTVADSKMGLTISFPQTAMTRAETANATVQDVKIRDVKVYIFDESGIAVTGNGETRTIVGDFTDHGDNTYTLTRKIETTKGAKRIYVGANLPSDATNFPTETELLSSTLLASGLYVNSVATDANGPAMISGMNQVTLVAGEDAANTVNATLTRMMAKTVVLKQTDFNANPTQPAKVNGTEVTFTATPVAYTVTNVAKRTNIVPKYTVATTPQLLTPGDGEGVKTATNKYNSTPENSFVDATAQSFVGVTAANINDGTADATALYVPEHSPSTLYLRGESTAALVKAELTPKYYAKINDAGVLEFTAIAGGTVFAENVNVVQGGGYVLFVQAADLSGITAKYPTASVDVYRPEGGKYYTYYWVFINMKDKKDDPNRLEVKRNNFYKIGINSIVTIGQPDTDDDDKGEEVFETPAKLNVTLDIAPWVYQGQADTPLE